MTLSQLFFKNPKETFTTHLVLMLTTLRLALYGMVFLLNSGLKMVHITNGLTDLNKFSPICLLTSRPVPQDHFNLEILTGETKECGEHLTRKNFLNSTFGGQTVQLTKAGSITHTLATKVPNAKYTCIYMAAVALFKD